MDEDECRRDADHRRRRWAVGGLNAATLLCSALFAAVSTQPLAQQPAPQQIKCEAGPLKRTFGGTEWLVYGCDERASMVVVSAPGNPAMPFYFFIRPEAGTYRIEREGSSDSEASRAAGNSLSQLTPAEVASLLTATSRR